MLKEEKLLPYYVSRPCYVSKPNSGNLKIAAEVICTESLEIATEVICTSLSSMIIIPVIEREVPYLCNVPFQN